jgi:hypothetical protein
VRGALPGVLRKDVFGEAGGSQGCGELVRAPKMGKTLVSGARGAVVVCAADKEGGWMVSLSGTPCLPPSSHNVLQHELLHTCLASCCHAATHIPLFPLPRTSLPPLPPPPP